MAAFPQLLPEQFASVSDSDNLPLNALDHICTPLVSEQLQAGAFLSIMRAFEKGVSKEHFGEMLDQALNLWDQLARIRFIYAMQIILAESGQVSTEKLEEGKKLLTTKAEGTRKALIELMEKVKKIPPKGTTKH